MTHRQRSQFAWAFIVAWLILTSAVAIALLDQPSCRALLDHAQETGLAADYAAAEKQCGPVY